MRSAAAFCVLLIACAVAAQPIHPLYRCPPRHPKPTDIVEKPAVKPVRIAGKAPVYPEVAKKARVCGMVIVELLIERDGRVSAARILKPLPFGLDQAVIDAVKTWRYKPAKQNGRAVRTIWEEAVAMRPPE